MVVRPHNPPVKCPHCLKDSGFTELGLAHYVIPYEGLQCEQCGEFFLKPNRPMFGRVRA